MLKKSTKKLAKFTVRSVIVCELFRLFCDLASKASFRSWKSSICTNGWRWVSFRKVTSFLFPLQCNYRVQITKQKQLKLKTSQPSLYPTNWPQISILSIQLLVCWTFKQGSEYLRASILRIEWSWTDIITIKLDILMSLWILRLLKEHS